MEGMINVDGLKITEEVAIEFMRDTDPDAAPVNAGDFFQQYLERGATTKAARQKMTTDLIEGIQNGGRFSVCDDGELCFSEGFSGHPDFMAFDWFRDRVVEIDWNALGAYLEDQINLWENARKDLEEWVRARPHLKEGVDWKIAPEEKED